MKRFAVATALAATFALLGSVFPALTPSASASVRPLTWAAPGLVDPVSITMTSVNQVLVLDNSRDYVIKASSALTAPGGVSISGGHNVVFVGADIVVPTASAQPDPTKRRGLHLKGQTGIMHVEGVHIAGVDLSEGIDIDERLGATVQIENVVVDMVHGTQATNHADVIQTWAGPYELRVDGLRGYTDYQGLFLMPFQYYNGPIAPWILKNIDITGSPVSGYMLWKDDNLAINSANVNVRRSDNTTNKMFWANASQWPGAVNAAAVQDVISGVPGTAYGSSPVVVPVPPSTSTTVVTPAPSTTTTTAVPAPTAPSVPVTTAPAGHSGYWMVASDGGIFSFGDAGFYGSTGGINLNKPIVGMAPTSDRRGYWLVASDGGIFSFGDAGFYGSTGSVPLNKPIVGMARTASGKGYWMVASDGGIFSFGDAGFYGSTGGINLNKPIVGMARTASGKGYWLVASDGGIFSFGDAGFYGSTGGINLNKPIVAMSTTATGNGYWMIAADGGIFSFGDAGFYGSSVGRMTGQATSISPTASGHGYWIQSSTGWVGGFGDAEDHGSVEGALNRPVVGGSATVR